MRLSPVFILLSIAGPASAQTGFPVVTHYPQMGGTTPDTTRVATPSYEIYSAARSDEYAPTQVEFNAAVQLMFQATGVRARVVNSSAELSEGIAEIQVVNNWIIGAALYTVAVPPNWRRANSYPILLSGNPTSYSNNFRVYRAQEAGILAFSANEGFIAAYSNAGGIESQGISDGVLRSVGAAIDAFVGLGGDRQRVVTAGFSRGASTALVWAANPLELDYRVIAAFGHSLPASTLDAVLAPYATYPMLGWLADTVTGNPQSSRYSSAPPPHTLPNRVLQILTGQGDMEVKSALSYVERLRRKQLVFSFGSHDPVVPFRNGVTFVRALEAANIPAMPIFVLNAGHSWSNDVYMELARALDLIGRGQEYVAPPGRVYAAQNDTRNHDYQRQMRMARATMPFSTVVPFRAAPGQPARIDVCGAPGASYTICAVLDGTALLSAVHVTGTIPPEECASHSTSVPLAQGQYHWRAEVNGTPMSRTFTSVSAHSAALEVLPSQPGNFEAMIGQQFVAEGFSELSPHNPGDALPCPPSMNAPMVDAGFADSGLITTLPDAASSAPDAGLAAALDAEPVDTGNAKPIDPSCGCASSAGGAPSFVLLIAFMLWRRRR